MKETIFQHLRTHAAAALAWLGTGAALLLLAVLARVVTR